MKHEKNLTNMSNKDFLRDYESEKTKFEKWQQEYKRRESAIKYEKSKVLAMLNSLSDIMRSVYMGDVLSYTEQTEEYKEMFCSLTLGTDILDALMRYAYITDNVELEQ